MSQTEAKKLDTILAKIEALQKQTKDDFLCERLRKAKSELFRALNRR
jgi:hypothetical protein